MVLGSQLVQKYKGQHRKTAIEPDGIVTEARVEDFDAVLIPGGIAAERIRINIAAVRFVQAALHQNLLVAAIGHGPQVLIEADVLRERNATGARAIRKDLQNAGANYINEPLVTDGILVTARRLGDLPHFHGCDSLQARTSFSLVRQSGNQCRMVEISRDVGWV